MVSAIALQRPPQLPVVMVDDWEEMREELDADPPQPVVGDYSDDLWVLSKVVPEVLAYAVRARMQRPPAKSASTGSMTRASALTIRVARRPRPLSAPQLDWRDIKDTLRTA